MATDDVYAGLVPDVAKQVCAFFRVWCLVELTTALRTSKPVIMLVGKADDATGGFVPEEGMLRNLLYSLDVAQAEEIE